MKRIIIVISSTCSQQKYNEIYETRTEKILDSSQKFFHSLLMGMAKNNDVSIRAVSVIPVSHSCYKTRLVKEEYDVEEKVEFNYVPFVNYPIIKTVSSFLSIRKEINAIIKSQSNCKIYILCDPLALESAGAALCFKKRATVSCLVTDLPMMSDFENHRGIKKVLYRAYNTMSQSILKMFDKYVVLVNEMNDVINPLHKPSLLLECIISIQSYNSNQKVQEKIIDKNIPQILYAGKIHKEFGLDLLASAMELVKNDCALHVYGEGNYKNELKKIGELNNRITVHDAVTVEEIIELEKQSDLLVNPRTSQEEFSRYSFPSKTVEYMMSGVPVVMFKLPGIPNEYDKYLNYAKDETAESLAACIDEVLNNYSDTKQLALDGKKYVLETKNHIYQGKRVIEFLEKEQ